MEQKQPLQQMGLGYLHSYVQKNETQSLSYAIHKNKFKVDKRLKYKTLHHKSPTGKHWQENYRYPTQQYLHRYVPLSKGHKRKNKQMGLHQNKKLVHS